jgi:hypothetical protein
MFKINKMDGRQESQTEIIGSVLHIPDVVGGRTPILDDAKF